MESDNNLPTPPISPESIPETIVKPNHKIFYIILGLIILFLLVLVIISLFLSKQKTRTINAPSPTPVISTIKIDTQNWKTYSDNAAGFSIKYPEKWLSVSGKIYPSPTCPNQKTFQNKDCMDGYITFKVFTKKYGQPIKDDVQEKDKSLNQDNPQYYENGLSQYLLNIGAIQADYMGMYGPLNVYIPTNSVADISYLEISSFALDRDIFYQILSTFKFVDANLISFVKNKLGDSPESSISVEKIEGDYALGSAGTADGTGFYWAAAKINDKWSYLMSGNGIPSCKDVEIFPIGTFKLAGQSGKLDNCYNDKSELIDRRTGLLIK